MAVMVVVISDDCCFGVEIVRMVGISDCRLGVVIVVTVGIADD